MEHKLYVNSSPHIKDVAKTSNIMFDVIIALIPATIISIYLYSYMAAIIIGVTVVSSVLFEALYNLLTKQKQTVGDYSAVVTGLLLALNLPPSAASIWLGVIGSLVAIIIVKMIFGGIGNNIFNPAIAARVFLTVAFSSQMTTWLSPGADAISTATPLALASNGIITSNIDLFLGNIPGCLGETSALALLLGFGWLLIRKVIKLDITLTYLLTVVVFSFIIGVDPLFQILSGGLLLGAIFMATDYSTSPMTKKGKIIYGLGLGIITMGIRVYGNLPEGVSFSILFMNVLVPLIDRYTIPKSFGGVKKKNA
ncbi:MAG: RnfABCDGE type electron transport complex subunit D [Clostridiales bacterium]|nr:RnfABCDGE type electron transport complex subunit D [Clostridiales bacterium]